MAIETQNSGMPVQIRVCHRGDRRPNSPLVQAREIVDGLFREPAFAGRARFLEDGVDRPIGRRHGSSPTLNLPRCAGSEVVQNRARRFESGVNAFESFCG